MEIKDAIQMLFSRSDQVNVYWSSFTVIITALLGFLSTVKIKDNKNVLCAIMTLSFGVFSYANYKTILYTKAQILNLAKYLTSLDLGQSSELVEVINSVNIQNKWEVIHVSGTILVILLIWIIPYARSKYSEEYY